MTAYRMPPTKTPHFFHGSSYVDLRQVAAVYMRPLYTSVVYLNGETSEVDDAFGNALLTALKIYHESI